MIIEIITVKRENEEFNELIGKETPETEAVTNLFVKESSIDCFWVDSEEKEIIIYINGSEFRSHYDNELVIRLSKVICQNQTK